VLRTTFVARTIPLAIVLLGLCLPAVTGAVPSSGGRALGPHMAASTPTASLSASFEPERLGGRTTLRFGFQIAGPGGQVPPALTAVSLSYPESLGIAFSRLGLVTCTTAQLEASGVSGCPEDSIMGFGSATAEISLGADLVGEPVPLTILRAPDEEGHISLLFDAVDVPLIPSLPGAPDVAIVRLRATLGPSGVIYFKPLEGRTIVYQPPGLLLPDSCPKGGFPFAAQFSFVDGSHASARSVEACPARAARRHSRR